MDKIWAQTENCTKRQNSYENKKTTKKYRTDETTIKIDEFGIDPVVQSILVTKNFPTVYHGRRSDHRVKSNGHLKYADEHPVSKAYTQNP